MISGIKVQFHHRSYIKAEFVDQILVGTVIDKYLGIDEVPQRFPSGVGGTIGIDTKINVEFYLILGDDGLTYKKKCSDIVIVSIKEANQ